MLATTEGTNRRQQPNPIHQIIGAAATTTPTTPASITHATSATSAAQRAWIRLFEASRILRWRHHEALQNAPAIPQVASTSTVDDTLPRVGGNYDFVQLQAWPSNIYYITSNVFKASQPFPVTKAASSYLYKCDCDGMRCIADDGTRLTSGCINVGTNLICDDTNCSVGAGCGNRFESRYELDLISTRVGLGVVCSVIIPKGAFIVEYVGEMLLYDDAVKRSDKQYLVELKTEGLWDGPVDLFIDASGCGNESRFINHSCDPNCALYEWEWTNSVRLGIFAAKDIMPLQELTFRYRENSLMLFACQCDGANCVSKKIK